MAIRSFRCNDTENLSCSETERLFMGRTVRRFESVLEPAMRKLSMLAAASSFEDLPALGGTLRSDAASTLDAWAWTLDGDFELRFEWRHQAAECVEIVQRRRPTAAARPRYRGVPFPHPGEILHKEFLQPLALSQRRLAQRTGLRRNRIADLIAGQVRLRDQDAAALARELKPRAAFWMSLQEHHDRALVREALAESLPESERRKMDSPDGD